MKKFQFTLLLLLMTTLLFSQNRDACLIHKNGYFEYEGKHNAVVLLRKGTHQIEYDFKNEYWIVTTIRWINDCKYSFLYIDTNVKSINHYLGTRVDVNITSADKEGYSYHSVFEKTKQEFDGRIIKTEKQSISKPIRKKLNDILMKVKT